MNCAHVKMVLMPQLGGMTTTRYLFIRNAFMETLRSTSGRQEDRSWG